MTEVREAGRVRLRLRGELDLAGAPAFGEALRQLRRRGEPILLDLDQLAFIDMSGLRMVLAAAETASRDGGGFSVTPGPQVRRLMTLVAPDGHLPAEWSAG